MKKEESSAESSSDSSTDSVIPGKVFDGQYYVAYQVLRDKINSRFLLGCERTVLLYTLPDGNISVSENSSEYTAVNETKSEDYVILKTDGDIAYIALPFIQEYDEYGIFCGTGTKQSNCHIKVGRDRDSRSEERHTGSLSWWR